MKNKEWQGPTNTIERMYWLFHGMPEWDLWLELKWDMIQNLGVVSG